MSFTVAGSNTRIFRTRITNVNAELRHFQGEGIFFELNFDNFRTYTSSKGEGLATKPSWTDSEFKFNYSTEYAELLGAKIMKLSFKNSAGDFIGEAACELLTLATGPQDCRFTIKSGGTDVIGHVFANIEMEEVNETQVIIKQLTVTFYQGSPTPTDMGAAAVKVATKAPEPGVRVSPYPTRFDAYRCSWDHPLETNYFGSTVTSLMQEAGLKISLIECGWFWTETLFAQGTIPIGALPTDQLQNNPRNISFGMDDKTKVPLMDPTGAKEVGRVEGVMSILRMPKFAQMYGGQNIDGIVFNGQNLPGAKVFPPRVSGDVKEYVKI